MPPIKKPSRDRQKTFLREWRDFRGYTLEQAAEMIGMSRENLGKIENRRVPYNQDVLEQLAEAYNCEVSDLLIRDPTEPENIWSIWNNAKQGAKVAIISFAKTLKEQDASLFENKENDDIKINIKASYGIVSVTVPKELAVEVDPANRIRKINVYRLIASAQQSRDLTSEDRFLRLRKNRYGEIELVREDQTHDEPRLEDRHKILKF